MPDPKKTFHAVFTDQLGLILGKYKDDGLNRDVMFKMYEDIFNQLKQVVEGANLNTKLTNDALNWLAQAYYDAISIRSKGCEYSLDPTIFDKRPKLEDMSSTELVILLAMTRGTPFQYEVVSVLKRR